MIEKHTLKNGLKIITQQNKNSSAVAVSVMLKTGSRNETSDIHGISHFLEHMNFKGTQKRLTAPDIAKEVDSMGARFNASTGKENTSYYIQADKKYFEKSLDILSDIVFSSSLKEEEIKKEKNTIIEEINMREDTPMYLVPDLFEQILFDSTQISQNVIGERKTISKIDSRAMRDYRDKYYKAGNAIVSCAGNLPSDYKKKIEKYFSNVSRGTEDFIYSKTKNELYKKEVFLKSKDTEQTHIYMGVEAYDIKNSSRYAQDLLAVILGGNMSSRLFINIREKRGLAYYINADSEANFDSGIFYVRAGLNIQKTEEAVKVIKEELEKSKKDIRDQELKRVKDYVIGAMSLSEESSIYVAEDNAFEEIIGAKALSLAEKIKLYEKVSPDDIKSVASEIFEPERLKLAVIGPFKDESKFVKILESRTSCF
jgi:predicted Zn-dependent peptidase